MRAPVIPVVAALMLPGCLTYSPRDVSTMSAYELCDLQHFQRVNLTTPAKAALRAELERRNENCRGVLPQIERDREDDWLDRMYNRQSP